jgi:hypothetical protein
MIHEERGPKDPHPWMFYGVFGLRRRQVFYISG